MSEKNNKFETEPDWLNPKNDRKTPYTDQEIKTFSEDFIRGLSVQEWSAMKSKYGEKSARERIKAGFVTMDEKNLKNIKPEGSMQ